MLRCEARRGIFRPMSLDAHLAALFAADREADAAEQAFLGAGDNDERAAAAIAATDDALRAEGPLHRLRLTRLADLLAQIPGQATADKLVDVLDSPDPLVQDVGGRALVERAYARYAEVAKAVDTALDAKRSGRAMEVLPFVLAEVGEPSAVGFLRRFLAHQEPDVIASAIEASAELGDPEIVADLEKLVGDRREVTLDEAGDEDALTTTLGALAEETIEELELGFEGGED